MPTPAALAQHGLEETTVLAAGMAAILTFLTDLMVQNLALAGRCAAQPEVALSDALKDKVRRALVERTQDPGADLRARIAAGLALGELGDPRFVRRQGPDGAYLLRRWSTSLAGRITSAAMRGSMRTKRQSTASSFRLLPWRNSR